MDEEEIFKASVLFDFVTLWMFILIIWGEISRELVLARL